MRCFSWPIGACHGDGEVEMKMVEGGEVEGEEKIFWEIFVVEENERKEKKIFGEKTCGCGGRKELREKEKGKEIRNRRYFLGLQK